MKINDGKEIQLNTNLYLCISIYVASLHQLNKTLDYLKKHNDSITMWKTIRSCCADLAEAFIQVGQGAGNNASISVTLSPSCDGKGLPTARLAIGKYGAIIASQYTAKTQTHTHSKFQIHSCIFIVFYSLS